MVIENRELVGGEEFVARYKGAEHRVLVLGDEATGFGFEVDGDGKIHRSLSAAGSAVMGGPACNGWRFWSRAGELPAGRVKAEPKASPKPKADDAADGEASAPRAAKERKPSVMKVIRRIPNQKGVEEGHTKFFCSACMASFVIEGATEPETCPKGHAKLQADELAQVE